MMSRVIAGYRPVNGGNTDMASELVHGHDVAVADDRLQRGTQSVGIGVGEQPQTAAPTAQTHDLAGETSATVSPELSRLSGGLNVEMYGRYTTGTAIPSHQRRVDVELGCWNQTNYVLPKLGRVIEPSSTRGKPGLYAISQA